MSTLEGFTDAAPTISFLSAQQTLAHAQVDFSAVNASIGDVVQVLNIPKGAFVTNVFVRVKTAEGGTATALVGDGTDTTGWDASTNLNSVNTITTCIKGTDNYAVGKLYTSADTIDLIPQDALDTAVIDIFAEYTLVKSYT